MKKRLSSCADRTSVQTNKNKSSGDGLCFSPAPRDGTDHVEGFIVDSQGTDRTDVRKDSVRDHGSTVCTAAVAVCALLYYLIFGPTTDTLRLTAMCAILSSASLRDIGTRHVPDSHTIMLLLISVRDADSLRDVFAPYTGAVLLFIILASIRLILKKDSLGGADIKIVSAMSALTGVTAAAASFALALVFAIIHGSALKIKNNKETRTSIPLIPYLFAASVICTAAAGLIGKI